MQRQLHDDRADGINWERQEEQGTASTHVQSGADARTEGCVCAKVNRVNKHQHSKKPHASKALEQTQAALCN